MNDLLLDDLEAKIAALEDRVAALERPETDLPPRASAPAKIDQVTWVIIAAAVAAAGYGRIQSARAIVHPPRLDRWGIEGRREHFYSHRLR